MTEEPKTLIETIREEVRGQLDLLDTALAIQDPVARFRELEAIDLSDLRFGWAIAQAKADAIVAIKNSSEAPSLKSIGVTLGISPQRVHQLMNPERRNANVRRDTPEQ